MDAIQVIKSDHKETLAVLTQLVATTDRAVKKRKSIFNQFRQLLKVHEMLEEQVLYPLLQDYPDLTELIQKSYVAHQVVDVLLDELSDSKMEAINWKAKLLVLQDNLKLHIQEEEKSILSQLKKLLDKEILAQLYQDLTMAKKEIKHSF